jgi:hypothetical protein
VKRGSVVIEEPGKVVISGKVANDFMLPHSVSVDFDEGGSFYMSIPISSWDFRIKNPTPALAFGCYDCKEMIIVSDHGKQVKIGFTRIDEFERQVKALVDFGLWKGAL